MVKRFLICAVITTTTALLYVYQHTEIFKLAYLAQKRSARYQELLDKNTHLRYNNRCVSSLSNIGSRMMNEREFEIPVSEQMVRVNLPGSKEGSLQEARARTSLLSLLNIRLRQAEAKTIGR
ncbi:MAG: hypothetical protein PHR44_04305 [Candidatus Omnitrophica bacterium]|nr:hypothetical protein [Candidatus Omnitrophota bacterium]